MNPRRTRAFIVNKHSEIVRGKSRMVFNYKRLNDNTEHDIYHLSNKEALLKGTNIYSKLDLKSGFWQIKLEQDSRKWTPFVTHNGHYEWNVMPFGLKNAPQIFQRKIDNIFRNDPFIITYIDDVLVFSNNIKEYILHLRLFFPKM